MLRAMRLDPIAALGHVTRQASIRWRTRGMLKTFRAGLKIRLLQLWFTCVTTPSQ